MSALRPSAAFVTALALLLAAAPAHASAVALRGHLTAASMTVEGSPSVEAEVLAVSQDHPVGSGVSADPAFTLVAEHVDIETDVADYAVRTTPTRVSLLWPRVETRSMANATLVGFENRPGYWWFLAATDPRDPPVATIESLCSAIAPAEEERFERIPKANLERPSTIVDTSSAVEWSGCMGGADLLVRGSFLLSLWEWDAVLPSGDVLRSGSAPIAGASATFTQDRQVFITVRNGTLHLPGFGVGARGLYASGIAIEGAATLRLKDALGAMEGAAGAHSLAGDVVVLEGDLRAQARRADDDGLAFPFTMAGSAGAVHADGVALAAWQNTAPSGGASPWWLMLVGAALAGVWLVHRRWTRPVTAGLWRHYAADLEDKGRHRVALLAAYRAVRLDAAHPRGYAVRALIQTNRQRFQAAMTDFQRAHERYTDPAPRSVNAYEAARACALQGHADRAAHWLRMAMRDDPQRWHEAAMEPDFARVAAAPEFRILLGNAAPDPDLLGP